VPGLAAKRLELLREALPGMMRVAVLANPGHEVSAVEARETIAAARAHGLSIVLHEVGTPTRLNAVFTAIRGEGSLAVIVLPDVMFLEQRTVICNLAARHAVPVVAWTDEFVESGALMSYGPSVIEMHRRAAAVVDRILRGIDPTELPVAEPATLHLAINLKTAARLGLTISPTVSDRADRVIQ
jgi:putative tryptophan/tyrosine transport system substrate-binding protein